MDLNLREKKEDQLIITDHGWKNIYFCVLNDSYKLKTRKKNVVIVMMAILTFELCSSFEAFILNFTFFLSTKRFSSHTKVIMSKGCQ